MFLLFCWSYFYLVNLIFQLQSKKLKKILPMKLSNLDKKLFLSLILFIFFSPLFSEDSVDIWKKKI